MMRSLFRALYGTYALTVLLPVLLLLTPLVVIWPTAAGRRHIGQNTIRLGLLLIGIPPRVHGRMPDGVGVVVSNHASYLDGLLLAAVLPARYTFAVQDGVRAWPLAGRLVDRFGVTWIDRGNARRGSSQTRQMMRSVRLGKPLAIFPEATFKPDPGLLRFRNGAFMIAAHAGVPIVPVVIHGTRQFFGGGARWPTWHPLRVEILEPLPAAMGARDLHDLARARILERCGEPDTCPPTTAVAGDQSAPADVVVE